MTLATLWFNHRVAKVTKGMTPAQVQSILGEPTESESGTIPSGSAGGLQEGFHYKLFPGDPYLQWLYRRGKQSYYLWFAQEVATGEWRLSFNTSWTSIVDRPY